MIESPPVDEAQSARSPGTKRSRPVLGSQARARRREHRTKVLRAQLSARAPSRNDHAGSGALTVIVFPWSRTTARFRSRTWNAVVDANRSNDSCPNRCPDRRGRCQTPLAGESRRYGRSRMARPGLEPGTPRFSVVRLQLSNQVEIARNSRFWSSPSRRHKVRKFQEFLADSGDERRDVSQSGLAERAASRPAAAARGPEFRFRTGIERGL